MTSAGTVDHHVDTSAVLKVSGETTTLARPHLIVDLA
ncbi:hypothetical protein QFZ40_002940 [Arthrobacter pascens]|nr:hypothetical protein [Arthrobacter pascens]